MSVITIDLDSKPDSKFKAYERVNGGEYFIGESNTLHGAKCIATKYKRFTNSKLLIEYGDGYVISAYNPQFRRWTNNPYTW